MFLVVIVISGKLCIVFCIMCGCLIGSVGV